MTMRWTVGRKIGAGFSLAVVVFLIVGAVSYQSTTTFVAAQESRRQTYEILRRLSDVFSLAQDIQIGQRGYALTGDQSYLAPYQAAVASIDTRIEEIRTLVRSNPQQQNR